MEKEQKKTSSNKNKKFTKTVCTIGAGYVGGPTTAVLALHNPDIKFVVADINTERINSWNTDQLPIYEPGLLPIIQSVRDKNLFFTTDVKGSIEESEIIFIAVNTGTKSYGKGKDVSYDLFAFESVARTIGQFANADKIVVEKSTIPVGTGKTLLKVLNSVAKSTAEKAGRKNVPKFQVISNPEFLAEGVAIKDLQKPHRVLLGSSKTKEGLAAVQKLVDLYTKWVPKERVITVHTFSSELTKLASNAMLAQRLSSVNSLSAICEQTGANMDEVALGIGTDNRIGNKFLKCSLGFGGSCFKKDLLGLSYICDTLNLPLIANYWRMVVQINDNQTKRFCDRIFDTMNRNLRNKTILILGFSFKAFTGDIRESAAIAVTRYLLNERAKVRIYDPQVKRSDILGLFPSVEIISDPMEGCSSAEAVVICTEWPEFTKLDFNKIYKSMKLPAYIFDGRAILDTEQLEKIGFTVKTVGR